MKPNSNQAVGQNEALRASNYTRQAVVGCNTFFNVVYGYSVGMSSRRGNLIRSDGEGERRRGKHTTSLSSFFCFVLFVFRQQAKLVSSSSVYMLFLLGVNGSLSL